MATPTDSIVFGWREHPDQGLYRPTPEPIPGLYAKLAEHDSFAQFMARITHGLPYTVFPLPAAYEIPGLIPTDLEHIRVPGPGYQPLLYYRRQPLLVFGDDMTRGMEIRSRIAFDSTGRLGTVLLGQDFLDQVDLHIKPGGLNTARLRATPLD